MYPKRTQFKYIIQNKNSLAISKIIMTKVMMDKTMKIAIFNWKSQILMGIPKQT